MTDLNKLSLTELTTLRRRGEFDAIALLDACLHRIAARDGQVRAFEYIDPERLQRSLRTTSLLGSGLEGIPFGVKDLMDTFDMPTGWGSPIYKGRQAGRDAGCIASLRACGALAAGKTVTTEFACFHPGKTRNPRNLSHTPGGSSQGSAAAVADFMLPLALGTQTAASIIRPAAYCGVVGYKSSRGEFDLGGVCTVSQTLDSLGFFVRDAHDLIIVRRALMRGAEEAAPSKPARVALVRTPHWAEASEAVQAAVERAARLLANENVIVDEVTFGPDDGALTEAHKVVMAYEVARSRMFEYTHHREHLSAPMARLIESGLEMTFEQYDRAITLAREWEKRLDELLDGVDFILSPSTTGEAPAGHESTGDPLFSRMWTLLGAPAVNLPAGRGENDLPIGIQLVGRVGFDDMLVRHAAWAHSVLADQACA